MKKETNGNLTCRIMHRWLGALITMFTSLALTAADEPAARPFVHPDRIRYDSQCLTIDGHDAFLYSGAFHYFRCPKELWRDRFQKIKDAGFNCVETYVPWNWCEPQMPTGLDDFSQTDFTDLDDFLKMAEDFGLYVIVRPGPYICAEWDTGGYPQWLLTKQPAHPLRTKGWLRSDDPVYLAWCKHWYDAVCPVIVRHQLTRHSPGQAGVILVQLENEYDYAGFPDEVMLNQIRALATDARADGIDVPFITCWTHPVRGQTDPLLRQVFDACNFYPRWDVDSIQKDMEKQRREQPDAPLAITELQGGWFAQVGGKLSEDQDGVTAAQINNLTLFAIQNGATILNYYMLVGGTNPDDRAARTLTASYDYNAPIREWGGVGDRYQRVRALGQMLRDHGARLSRSVKVECNVTGVPNDVSVTLRQSPDGSRYFFVRTSQHTEPRTGTARVEARDGKTAPVSFNYQLEPFGSAILYLPPAATDGAQGEWLPEAAPAILRPADLPFPVTITRAWSCGDPGPSSWLDISSTTSLAQAGIYDSHFLIYRLSLSCLTATNLFVEFPAGDTVTAAVNGRLATPAVGTADSLLLSLPAGSNTVRLLYENAGHANGGDGLAQASGITGVWLTDGANVEHSVTGWHMQLVRGTSKRPEVSPNFDDTGWPTAEVSSVDADQLKPHQTAVFRATLDQPKITPGRELWLKIGRIDDQGWVYLNGHRLGRTSDWSREYSFDVTKRWQPGRNTLAIVVKNVDGGGGLGHVTLAELAKSAPIPLTSIGRPAGDESHWWVPGGDISGWRPVNLAATNTASTSGVSLVWYRLSFSLPAPPASEWVPWHAHLNASGDGFVYLNGHPLGRYWKAGPQHDFFLPECWLDFGMTQSNNLTISLRAPTGAVALRPPVIEPYATSAETR